MRRVLVLVVNVQHVQVIHLIVHHAYHPNTSLTLLAIVNVLMAPIHHLMYVKDVLLLVLVVILGLYALNANKEPIYMKEHVLIRVLVQPL